MLSPDLMEQIRRIEITAKHLVVDVFAGEYQSVFKGRGMEFEEVRPYFPGDDVRRIDWNVTARMASPFIRHYQEERELTVMLLADASGSSEFGTTGGFKRELAAELAAVLSFAATTNNDRIGLMVFTDQLELVVPPRKGRRHVLRMVRDLLVFQPEGTGTDIGMALNSMNLMQKQRCIVFLISDFIAPLESYRRALAATSRRHDVVAIDLHDPVEWEIPQIGIIALEDAETGELVWVDTDDEDWRSSYEEQVRADEEAKIQMMRSLAIDRIGLVNGQEYVSGLNDFFKRREKRLAR
ncbi:MAG: DUF58 domain-containing protein [Dehalococcoidia bacterium]|nr:DUF58 domain-containing protein [Dehalococcoidia bacterium]